MQSLDLGKEKAELGSEREREKDLRVHSLHLLCAASKAARAPGLLLLLDPWCLILCFGTGLLNSKISSCSKEYSPGHVVLKGCSLLPTVSLKTQFRKEVNQGAFAKLTEVRK